MDRIKKALEIAERMEKNIDPEQALDNILYALVLSLAACAQELDRLNSNLERLEDTRHKDT